MMPTQTAHRVALIDIGNTRMKIGWADLASGKRETTALALEHKNLDKLVVWFEEQNFRPDRAVGVNVAGPHKAQAVEHLFLNTFKVSTQWLNSPLQAAHVLNRYTNPAQLGVDRWIAMVGLSQHAPDTTTPLLLASCGTATTLDTLCPVARAPDVSGLADAAPDTIKWVYDGGLIFPGPG